MGPVHAHEAVLELDADADAAAPGAAITLELCGTGSTRERAAGLTEPR